MKVFTPISLFSLLALLMGVYTPSEARADAKLFTDLKCNKCHEIASLKIAKDTKGGDDEEDEDSDEETPDLSHVGSLHDAKFIKALLAKETAHVPHEGNKSSKKHSKKFKGTDAELEKMANWLASLK